MSTALQCGTSRCPTEDLTNPVIITIEHLETVRVWTMWLEGVGLDREWVEFDMEGGGAGHGFDMEGGRTWV